MFKSDSVVLWSSNAVEMALEGWKAQVTIYAITKEKSIILEKKEAEEGNTEKDKKRTTLQN